MIVKPRLTERVTTHDVIERRVVGAVSHGVRGVQVLRALMLGVAALPPLFAGVGATLMGNVTMGVPIFGFGLAAIWLAKRQLSRALRTV